MRRGLVPVPETAAAAPLVAERRQSSPEWLQPGGTGSAYETRPGAKKRPEGAAEGLRLTEENARAEEGSGKKRVTAADGAVVGEATGEGSRPTHHDDAVMNGAPGQTRIAEGLRPTHHDDALMNGAPGQTRIAESLRPPHSDDAVMNGVPVAPVRGKAGRVAMVTGDPALVDPNVHAGGNRPGR